MNNIKDKIFDFAQCIVDTSDGKVILAFKQQDKTNQVEENAAHFLKYDSERLGRDLELYIFIDKIMGTPSMLIHLLQEIIFPIQEEKWSCESSDYLKEWGIEVNEDKNVTDWINLF